MKVGINIKCSTRKSSCKEHFNYIALSLDWQLKYWIHPPSIRTFCILNFWYLCFRVEHCLTTICSMSLFLPPSIFFSPAVRSLLSCRPLPPPPLLVGLSHLDWFVMKSDPVIRTALLEVGKMASFFTNHRRHKANGQQRKFIIWFAKLNYKRTHHRVWDSEKPILPNCSVMVNSSVGSLYIRTTVLISAQIYLEHNIKFALLDFPAYTLYSMAPPSFSIFLLLRYFQNQSGLVF